MNPLPAVNASLHEATARTDADRLTVTTGRVRRTWRWTGAGLATCEVRHGPSGRAWTNDDGTCDWQLPDGTDPTGAELRALSAEPADDDGFTSEHLRVTADIAYPAAGMLVRLTIWAYPGAPGLRTQLSARRLDAPDDAAPSGAGPKDARVDRVPAGSTDCRRRWFGYYNDTQRRNDTHLDILEEHVTAHPINGAEWCDWAGAACVEDDRGGIALVKESHKCVNQLGHATGGFVCDETDGLACTGWGLRPKEVTRDALTAGWATWCLAWSGGDLDRELAFKTFDRLRYPIDPARDIYTQANTWGSTENSRDARRAAGEGSVLEELRVCADIGIDVLQIDDGWQVPPGHHTAYPEPEDGWRPHPESYPNGWATVRERARELGVKLGLWAAAIPISLDELKAAYTEGGFVQYKLDFANLPDRAAIDALMRKVRKFIAWTGHRVRVNWDVTENPPRYGYFFAREYGSIYLENRKPVQPRSAVYRPHTVLRDLWQVAKYLTLHRFQCPVQNVDRVDPSASDAALHSHAYATAMALMGIPLFFQETKLLSEHARREIRQVLDAYRPHREAIYRGIVHPVGDKPDNASWTGFQCHLLDEDAGYLTLFRERCNGEPTRAVPLAWLPPGDLRVTDLMRGTDDLITLDAASNATFRIDAAPGFLFLRYERA